MRRTISWKPRHIEQADAAKHSAKNSHSMASNDIGGLETLRTSTHCDGTTETRKHATRAPEPDGALSWLIVALCFLINMMSASFYRCLGLFYSALMSTLGVSRAEASLPLSAYTGFKLLSGLFSGVLIQSCGARWAATIGASLLTTGLLVSFFAEGVSFLVFSSGFLAGTGHGIIINSCLVCVCRYFDRRRGAALGLLATGGTAAALVFTKVYEYLLAEYGVRDAFLIIGALVGNVVPITLLMHPPPWEAIPSERKIVAEGATNTARNPCCAASTRTTDDVCHEAYLKTEHIRPATLQTEKPTRFGQINCEDNIRRCTGWSFNETPSVISSRNETIISTTHTAEIPRRCPLSFGQPSTTSRRETFSSCTNKSPLPPYVAPDLNKLCARRVTMKGVAGLLLYISNQVPKHSSGTHSSQARRHTVASVSLSCPLGASTVCSDPTSHEPSIMKDEAPTTSTLLLQNVLQVLKNPRFYFHVLSYVSRGFFFECFMTVALDFAQDAGVARADSVYVLTFYAVADAIGRLFVPYLSDYGLISNCGLLTISYLALCLLQQAAPYVAGKYDVWALSCALGLPSGYIIVGVPQILSTEIGPKNFPIAYGFMTTATAIGSFLRPLLIGFFRDNYGSYNGLFRLIGGMLGLSFVFNLGLWITDRSKQRELADDNAGSPMMGARPITTTEEKNTHV
ncbi:uncharacterized protein LOC119179588 isoform X4 [Rhipicephalus microplus]|uniref:uncharacterized protein LOC119179588 isoform X2 n=1 Tax=Rhipicephalus microplus TaxID=6941 RepID=UPI003F6D808C